jgi:hypothetical protein
MHCRLFALAAACGALASCGVSEIPRGRAPADPTAPGDPTDSAPGVTIAGVRVPRDRVIVFLHIGHSNMAGRSNTPDSLLPFNYDTDPRLWAYAAGGVWSPAHEPLSPDPMTAGRAGPGMSILHTALPLVPPDAYLVSIGHGQSGALGGYCRNYRRGGLFYDVVMAPARELKGNVTFGAIFTMLGVSEADDSPAAMQNFGTCLEGVASDMREDLGLPDLPFMVGGWEEESTDEFIITGADAQIIVPQLAATVARVHRSALISGKGLPMADSHHYDLTGYKTWSERAWTIMQGNGWVPGGAATPAVTPGVDGGLGP